MRLLTPARAAATLLAVALGTWSARVSTANSQQPVQVQMRNVALHVEERIVLNVRQLRGELIGTTPDEPPAFDDTSSFTVRIDSAEIAISVDGLSRLLNEHVFNYEGAPLEKLTVSTEGDRLKVKGTLKRGVSVPFTTVAEPRVDQDGNLRLRTQSVSALGVPAKRFLDFVGLELDKLMKLKPEHGVRVEGDDLILAPSRLVPPPRIAGRLSSVRIEPGTIVQIFGPGRAAPLHPPLAQGNYMYYRGGVLRFGKLTMDDADLELIDRDPRDPFDFFQAKYLSQLVAGYSKTTPSQGLTVLMPDYHRLAHK